MRKQRRQRKIEIFKLEDRVLFEAAGAAEAVEAADNANNPNPDRQHELSESERQEKEAQSVVKHVGPGTALSDPGAAVQEQGAGLAQPGTAHQDPAQKLVDGSADFSNVPDVAEHHSSDVSDFLNADFSDHSAAQLSFSDSFSADGHDLVIVDADAAKDLDLNSLPDNTEVLVLDHNSDAMDQINAYLDSHDGKFDSVKFLVDADPSGADSAREHLELNGKDVSAADLDAIREHVAEHGDLSVHTALDDSAPSYSLNPDGDFEHSADGNLHDTVIHPEIDKNITVNTDPADQIDPALANPVEDGRNELVIINSNMVDKDAVLSQIGEGRDVLEIDPSQDAMSQIQDYLDAHSDTKYDAVHIMTHGNDLGFYLGSTKVTTADQMAVFNGHMAENGDFMLYGCELASNEHGQSLIQDIADFTGCDVAASTNTTGISGDWSLEYNVGVIETANISIRNWNHDLNTVTVNNQSDWEDLVLNGSLADGDTIEFATSGNYLINQNFSFDTNVVINVSGNVDAIITVADGVTFDVNANVTVTNVTFVNHGTFNINDGATLAINTSTSGNVNVIENTGTLSIAGTLEITGSSSGSGGILTAVYNDGSDALVTVAETGRLAMTADSRVAYGLWNYAGRVNVAGGDVSLTNASGANSATIRNDYTGSNSVEISASSEITVEANTGVKAYAISNNDSLDIKNSFISASGSASIGLFNNTNGTTTFTVTENPEDNITAGDLAGYGSQVYGIIGGMYSVYNYGAFTMTTTLDSARYSGGNLENAPVMYLGGTVYTEAQGGSGKTSTTLNGVTVNGSIYNVSSATIVLNDVYLNGNLRNEGSNVYVTGDFFSPNFTVDGTSIAGNNRIIVWNLEYEQTHSYGNIYFGTALASSGYGSNDVTFRADQGYSFENYGGVMRIINFASLSSDSNPISIYNSGEFYMDATNAQGLAANGAYDLYVSYYGSMSSVEKGLNVTDAGIYNYNSNAYNPAYFVQNTMELTNLNIRNTQANSVAVTNNSGNLSITGGSLQGTYSGLDALSDLIVGGASNSWQAGSAAVTVYTPVTTLTDVEKIAGQAYSIRNTGDMTLSGKNTTFGYTLLTNNLDFSSQSYSGDYTAVFNASTTVYLNEQYTSEGTIYNKLAAYAVNPVQAPQADSWTWSAKSASSMTPGNITVSYVSAENMYARTTFTITPSSTYSRSSGNITLIDWHFGNYQVAADLNLDYVAFQANGSTATTTALGNWGNLIVSNINNDPSYQLSGFTVSLNNGSYSSQELNNMYFWASDYAIVNSIALRTPAWETGQNYATALYSGAPVTADVTVDFDLQAGKIWTVNTTVVGTITLRGIKASADSTDYEYNGRLIISGAAFTVDYGKTLNLENFSVLGVDGNGLVNHGKLGIYNGISLGNGGWKGGSNAYIEATNGIAIENHGTVRLINGAVLNSRIGIYNEADAGLLTIINSTLSGNSEWAIVSNRSGDTTENSVNFVVADTTIANNGNGIQVNNAGLLHLVNSIVLNHGGTDIALNGGASRYSATEASNIYGGKDGKDTDAWLNEVFGTTTPTLSSGGNVFVLVENSAALKGGVAFSYTVGSDGLYTYSFGSTDGEINVTWDKLGNDRTTQIGSYVLTGTPTPPTPTSDIIVNITNDYTGTITAEFIANKIKNENSEYSLREVIWAIQHQTEIGEVLGYEFVLDNTVQFAESLGTDFSLTVTAGAIEIDAGITVNIDIPADYSVTINASGNQGESAFTVTKGELNLENLTVEGDKTGGAERGAAIEILGGKVSLTDVALINGIAASGGAVYVANGSTLNVSGGRFENNTATGSGGAVYVASGGTLNVSASVEFKGNTAADNGGAVYNDGVVVLNDKTVFSGNEAVSGGAVYNQNAIQVNGDVTFTGNHAVNGSGGAIYNDGGFLNIAGGGQFESNTATENGGAIYNDGNGSLTIQGGEFSGNYTDSGDGGVIYNGSGALDLQGGNFSGNHAGGNGGVIYNGSGSLTIQGGEFSDNYAGGDGGVVYNASGAGAMNIAGGVFTGNHAGGNGGVVYNASAEGMTVFAAFSDNHAANGGAIYNTAGILNIGGIFIGNYAETGDGGAIYNESAAGMTVSAEFADNYATNGGAIYNKNGTLAISGGSFEENEARSGNGGAIYHGGAGSLTIDGTRLTDNAAAVEGGAVFSGNGALNVKNSTFSGNEAVMGAAIFSRGFATMDHVVFSGNRASGSVVTINGGDLKNLTVSGNTAGSGALFDSQGNKTVIDLSAFYDNTAGTLFSAGGTLYVLNSTFAEGDGDVTKHMITAGGALTILNTTVTGDMANRGDALVDADTIRSVNNIIVGTDASQTALNGSKVEAAYTIMSGTGTQVHGGVNDSNTFGINYRTLFGGNTVDKTTGTIALLNGSIAETGVWVGYNTDGDLYYSVRPDQLYPRYGIDKVDWKKFGSDTLIARPDNVKITEGLNGNTLPSIGSYWITQDVPTLGIGPGVNNTFIDPSFNGIGWNNNDIYNVVADSLIMNPGFLLNFRNEMPVGGHWYYDFTHAFDDRYSAYVGRFAVTLGRFDLGFVPSGENYISVNVNSYVSDDFTRYTTTPYLSDGTPLIPAELESMNSETTAPATEGSFDLPEGLEEKLVSYLGRAEIFKNDFDKALDQLLAVNA